jgi:bifunctional ADP-heptose synthase (sugar kinase/adenylyltransferase)
VLVKGGDYRIEEIVGARDVQGWGGLVQVIPFLDGYSSTALIEKIVAKQ